MTTWHAHAQSCLVTVRNVGARQGQGFYDYENNVAGKTDKMYFMGTTPSTSHTVLLARLH